MWTRLTILAILFAITSPLRADPPMTKLRIEVRNPADKPVDRAGVIVRFVEGRSIAKFGKKIRTHWELRTNQEGVVNIPPIPQGKILIQVIAKGYQTFGEYFEVNEEEKTVPVHLKSPQPQYSAH